MSEQILWEIMDMEAVEKCYLYKSAEEKYAEKPAIIISSGPFVSPDAKRREFYTVWFGQGIAHYNVNNLAQADRKLREILSTAKVGMQAKIVHRTGRIELVKVEP